ncbi:tRNA (adenosine(37)-N6)-threonylcarbamoyltransferase complex dimerization subunit type 1 TsaB [Alpinimonas psychrophila]
MILAIDTSAGTSVALVENGRILAEHSVIDTMRHAEVVGALILECLTSADILATDVTAVVAGMGPGPFTGLRVGIAAAEAFSVGANITLLPMVSHDGIATAHYAGGARGPITVVTDARRRELYWSTYSGLNAHELPQRISGPNLAKQAEVPAEVLGLTPFILEATEVSAGALAITAERMATAGEPFGTFRALYLRSPDVTLSKGPKRVVQ